MNQTSPFKIKIEPNTNGRTGTWTVTVPGSDGRLLFRNAVANLNDEAVRHALVDRIAQALEEDSAAILDELEDAWDESQEGQGGNQQQETGGYRFRPLSAAEFATRDFRPSWYVKQVMVAGQPFVFGASKKSLKTTLGVELVLSLGSGLPFLEVFEVVRKCRVAFVSGESGEWTLQETARRICAAKGIQLADTNTLWDFRLPQLANPLDMDELRAGLEREKVEVLIIDPLYLTLLAGQVDIQASNLFQMGPLLLNISQACLSVGCTPGLIHHSTKRIPPGAPIDLDDLAFAGIAEFARQWLLINRREAYEPGSGSHKIWLSAGGSVGHGGLWGVDIEEGQLGDDFTGRHWAVTVSSAADTRSKQSNNSETSKEERKQHRIKEDGNKVLEALDFVTQNDRQKPASCMQVRAFAGFDGERMNRAVAGLIKDGIIEEVEIETLSGKNHSVKKKARGLRRRPFSTDGIGGRNPGLFDPPANPD